MAEEVKVRLVRCPKCDNVLPEHPDYSVYQCGGCGTVLRAKTNMPVTDGLSEKSDELLRLEQKSESLDGDAEPLSVDNVDEIESRDGVDHDGIEGRISRIERGMAYQSREALKPTDRSKAREIVDMPLKHSRHNDKDSEYGLGSSSVLRDGESVNLDRLGLGEYNPANGNHNGPLRPRDMSYQRKVDRDGRDGEYWNSRGVREQGKVSFSSHPNEEQMKYQTAYVNNYGLMTNQHHVDGVRRVENLEHDRAELLRKLKEMEDQIRTSTLSSGVRRVQPDPYGGHDTYMTPSHAVSYDKASARSPYFTDSPEHVPSVNRHDRDMRYLYSPSRNVPDPIPRYESSLRQEMPRRPPPPPPQLSPIQHPSRSYYTSTARWYPGTSEDPIDPYPRETSLHHPTCSCVDCSYRNRQVPPSHVPYSVNRNKRYQENSNFPNFHHDVNPVNHGQRYNPRELRLQYPLPRRENLSDAGSDLGGTRPYRPRRVVMSLGKRRLCHPLAGGAPFITCHNCWELLKVPRKFMLMEKHKRKLRCGACATLISFESENKGLIVSKPAHTEVIVADNDKVPNEVFNNNLKDSHPESPYIFQPTDTETNLQSNERRLNMNDSKIKQELRYSSSVSSEESESPDSVIVHNNVPTSAEPSSRVRISLPLPVSPDSDSRPYNNVASRYGMGNRRNIMNQDQESDFRNNSTSGRSSVKDIDTATEMDVSFNDRSGNSFAPDSAEVSRGGDRFPKHKKGNRSFFGSIKRSFRDSPRSSQSSQVVENVRSNVSINGKPISPRAVEKAEMLAGTIQPGDYWYDYRAGFWGVLGHPCHGIIPPYIQEFDFPMPRKCGAGNTGVCVNGRELHQKDLNLLANRGLPIISNKSYIIDISGKVMDENSGKELQNLGKLAPTVEKTRKGFGMKVPQVSL